MKNPAVTANCDFIAVIHNGSRITVSKHEIVLIRADDHIINVYLLNKRHLFGCGCLRRIENMLAPEVFLRVSRSAIVNMMHVLAFRRSKRCLGLLLANGATVCVAARKVKAFLAMKKYYPRIARMRK
jgi:DNA-binding LytR/AlgR family response regulator